ncbi:conserved oligomeric Golgi complex subunit 6-like isoform X2 [Patiria miniata]|uniref:Conserved oligomeric Golgi complex subunit 6 n=1 Tax=Patiria miniata TaxID=46514 RepID=A0A913ZHA1_PATMI|nr:conserved oligomeric Golgi complex subunit 6-like isoform X1 [Patiria miniata]XP_038050784.1 conserved oligomeric Golgi complex subunit 6-like isoform X2 [Patiria miniata]
MSAGTATGTGYGLHADVSSASEHESAAVGQHETAQENVQSANPLSRKLNKILDIRLENDKDILEALKVLSAFFSQNTLRSRRNLRGDIERRSLAISEDFAEAFEKVKGGLDSIHSDVESMRSSCQEMTGRLKAAREQTSDLISKTTDLHKESQQLDMRANVTDAFLEKFQLTTNEVMALRGPRNGQLLQEFFAALERVKQIHNDCKILLRTNQQTAGLEIMESMALHEETAYERLYRWIQGECRGLTGDTVEISALHCEAVAALQDRTVLFRYTLDEFGTARRSAMVRGFIEALTRGGPGGTPRPIELHCHEPLRYVGDMFAWLHQTTASEKEHIQGFLRLATSQSRNSDIEDVLGHITEGVCRPLKVRVEQVIVADPGPVLLYRLTNLLKFYTHTISQFLGKEAMLLSCLEEQQELCQKVFFNALTVLASKLVDKVELPPADLGPTPTLTQNLALLREILMSHDSSVVPLDARHSDFVKILGCVLDPLLQMCSLSASRLNPCDMAAYMINCLYAMQSCLALYEFTDQRLEMIAAQISAHQDTLVNEQASYVLSTVSLIQVYSIAQQHKPSEGPLSLVHGMDTTALRSAMVRFDTYLSSPDSSILSQCHLINSPVLREEITKRGTELVCGAYQLLFDSITNPANGYQEPKSIVIRTPDQVRALLL